MLLGKAGTLEMAITSNELVSAIDSFLPRTLTGPQKKAIRHGTGPLWIIAGPGTGKTEVLVDRCLKLVCVDRVPARSIALTTFTEKAAGRLQDRLHDYLGRLQQRFSPCLNGVDVSELRVGTLHSLCSEIMQEYRHPGYRNVRLLDEVQQALHIRRDRAFALRARTAIWSALSFMVSGRDPTTTFGPNLWQVTRAALSLFNRLVEDGLDLDRMRRADPHWRQIVEEYDEYVASLDRSHMCDFAHLQTRFLSFLRTERGKQFLVGDGTAQHPGIRHVLVDEYQDTNPIQEQIYFTLAGSHPHNLTVVGDDDQALYRFRGATVECMVEFGSRCSQEWPEVTVRQVQLVDNFRSHPAIVKWCNDYIGSFPSMSQGGARAPNKRELQSASPVGGDHPAVGWISADRVVDLPAQFVSTLMDLKQHRVIDDYSQCVLLMRSTQETPSFAGRFVSALEAAGVPVYNPRSKAYADREEVGVVMGALLEILDPDQRVVGQIAMPEVGPLVGDWIRVYKQHAASQSKLRRYVERSKRAIAGCEAGEEITPAVPTILYRIMSFEPCATWQKEEDRDRRLSKLTRIFEAYCSLVGRSLRADRGRAGQVSEKWLLDFYYLLVGYVSQSGMDDDEIEEEVCPPGRLPIMTIHQAKGLEFPFVFVGALGVSAAARRVHHLEDALAQFRATPPAHSFTASQRAEHDLIRMFYVAYSRAQHALILLGTRSQLKPAGRVAAGGQGIGWLNQRVPRL